MRICNLLHRPKSSEEVHAEARLVEAERELEELKVRAREAIGTLDARASRNHWRESIEQMITGVPPS